MKFTLKNIIVPSIPLAVFLVGTCGAFWISNFFLSYNIITPNESNLIVLNMQYVIQPNTLLSNILSGIITLFNAFLIAQFNNKYTIIRTRTFLPIFIFLLLMSSWNDIHLLNGSHFALTLFILALFFFFDMYRDPNASEQAFMGSFLISAASLIVHPLVFVIPVCWMGFIMLKSLSLRTFLGSVFGALTPWILYISGIYILNPKFDISKFDNIFNLSINIDYSLSSYSLPTIIYIVAMVIFMIIGLLGLSSSTHSDAVHTRTKINFIMLLFFAITIIGFLFKDEFASTLPLIALFYSILISHPFTLIQNKFYSNLFFIFCLLNIAYFISYYYTF
jgi:hypothetical protein